MSSILVTGANGQLGREFQVLAERYAGFAFTFTNRQVLDVTDEPAVFFVSRGYVQLACALTEGLRGPRHLFYNSTTPPDAPGFILNAYETRTRTNWQYECAKSLLAGNIEI